MKRRLWLPLLAVPACKIVVDGEVDGRTIELRSGYFTLDRRAEDEGGPVVLQLAFGSGSDACDADTRWAERAQGLTDPEELATAASDLLPAKRWVATATTELADKDVDLTGATLAIGGEQPEVVFGLTRYLQALDVTYWQSLAEGRPVVTYVDGWRGEEGALEVELHQPGFRLRGTLTTELVDPSTRGTEGALELSFDVRRCAGVEAVLYPRGD